MDLLSAGEDIVKAAKARGADVAECILRRGSHLSAKVRMREPEHLEEATSSSVGLRVFLGQQVAVSHTSDLTKDGLGRLVDDALELARLAQPDPFSGPPSSELLSKPESWASLDLVDETIARIGAGEAIVTATRAEAAAFDCDRRVTNSEGANFARVTGNSALVTSGGFRGDVAGTYVSLSVRPVIDDKDGKKRTGSYWSATRHYGQLESAEKVGRKAAEKTLAQLGARKVPTQEVPVIFDPDAGRSILGLLAGCILGGSIWRRSSYLLDRIGTRVASDLVTVIDDPLIARGPGSRAFDGEGLASRRNFVVERGMLRTYLLDTYSARKLKLESTASASRGSSGGVGPSTTNFVLQPTDLTPEQLIRSTPAALYVTDMMGFGFNAVTGDFSRGASGFWIEKGEKTFPVSEVTISLNLDQLLQRIDAVANDLDLRSSTACPTFRVSSMTLAGG